MHRRQFMQQAAVTAAGLALGANAIEAAPSDKKEEKVTAARLPRWRGFNLLEKFSTNRPVSPFLESDFAWMAEWGFDFVRLPMSYRCWTDADDWLKLKENVLKEVDQAVEFGRKHGIHVNINFHRAPGYCVNPPKEPAEVWSDDQALKACVFHWAHFAKRYKGIPNARLSFNLFNEPGAIPEETYVRVVKRLAEAIRAEDADRLIIADGLRWGSEPVPGLVELGVGQSTRGYSPHQLSHYKASWMPGSDKWPEPDWPLKVNDKDVWDKERLRKWLIEPWKKLESKGVGVHVGECGVFKHTPHKVALAWLGDFLDLWKEAGWGWALWNFRGPFGILDSERADVKYEDFRGHKLDQKLLEVLRTR